MYIVTKIQVKPRHILKSLNNNLRGGMNEITIVLERKYKILWFTKTITKRAEGVLSIHHDIHNYIKIGDNFNIKNYPILKIT